jgi:protein-tyrosine-phosphatase
MAEAITKEWFDQKIFVDSCGIKFGKIDYLAVEVMAEKKLNLARHKSKLFSELDNTFFDLIITFTKEAYQYVLSSTKTQSCVVEYFDIPDASLITGNRQQRLDGYREVRDVLTKKLHQRLFDYL